MVKMTKTSFAIAALMLGTTGVLAHPSFRADCKVVQRNHALVDLTLDTGERLDLDAPLLKIGPSVVTCKGDLGPGPAMVLDFANTHFPCLLGPEAAPLAKTTNWKEIITATGEATLICDFGPR